MTTAELPPHPEPALTTAPAPPAALGPRTAAPAPPAEPAPTAGQVMDRVRAYAADLPARASEIERLGRLPADVLDGLKATGLLRAALPPRRGGVELTVPQITRAVDLLARGDGSVAWCAAVALNAALAAVHLPDEVFTELFPDPDMVTATVLPPTGRAVRRGDGYLLSGRWAQASGITHADRMLAGFHAPDGTPRIAVLDTARLRVIDTWHTTGLRGTGSHDVEAVDLHVPRHHTFALQPPGAHGEPPHLRADNLAHKMAGIPLGIAGAALDSALELLAARRAAPPWPGAPADLARAESLIGAADAYVYSTLEKAWAAQTAGVAPERGTAALARRFAHRACREAVQLLYDAVGSAAVYTERTPLDRCLRDLITAGRHVASAERILDGVGTLRLGGDPASPHF
ncbi:alkylation response protein AidB-like acyl-CoA dehydrogenase [Streptomyces sp. PanSC19]|uniref:acyl-CoA dehydrogenase family protein n=1 Tax=Streptomyces sp. PanSC19 TaxID=1520455 RepID=UPI000F4A6108|nr:acyl-CoA dehydrogenase family protein [Streptomyces sp. PanSC19]ROQ34995.1 alkylation response protein AidB-like acyl-CoA dehydrogenase [Streptomyces sp. PanSC19]